MKQADTRRINLPAGWDACLGLNGRTYYCSKQSQTVQILPPPEVWRCSHNLPYGWEMAADYDDKNYYINHVAQTTTYEDPRTEDDQQGRTDTSHMKVDPQPRQYEIARSSKLGFGFIAGSEKPVIIRSVTPGGPSEGKLLPDDQIVKIGSENVMKADRERVIELIREQDETVVLTVLQPNRGAKSSFLKPIKKMTRSSDRPKVRFADDVVIKGQEQVECSSPLLISPGMLRIQLETGQTRSFQFFPDTTASDAIVLICEKLDLHDPNMFSLVLTPHDDVEENKSKKSRTPSWRGTTAPADQFVVTSSLPGSLLVAPWDCLSKVASDPVMRNHSCHFRLEFMPEDFHKLAQNDPEAFRYLYMQCVNDVVSGDVYNGELSQDDLIKLASIQIQVLMLECALSSTEDDKQDNADRDDTLQRTKFHFPSLSNRITVKNIEKEYGLRRFLPVSLIEAMQRDAPLARGVRKNLQQQLKVAASAPVLSQSAGSPMLPTSPRLPVVPSAVNTPSQLKLQYLKILSPRYSFGGRYFSASMQGLMESDITVLVGHHYGISQIINSKTVMVSMISEFNQIRGFEVEPCSSVSNFTRVKVDFAQKQQLSLTMEPQAAHNLAFMVSGYCRVYGNVEMVLTLPIAESTSVPLYFGTHKVKPSTWNYSPTSAFDSSAITVPDVSAPLDPFSHQYFYCDFSQPVTPAILAQVPRFVEKPRQNGYNRPPTPPPAFGLRRDSDAENGSDANADQGVVEKRENSKASYAGNHVSSGEDTRDRHLFPELSLPSLPSTKHSDAVNDSPSFASSSDNVQIESEKLEDEDWTYLMSALGTRNSDIAVDKAGHPEDVHPSQRSADSDENHRAVSSLPKENAPKSQNGSGTEEAKSDTAVIRSKQNSLRNRTDESPLDDRARRNRLSSFKPDVGDLKVFTCANNGPSTSPSAPSTDGGEVESSTDTESIKRSQPPWLDEVMDPVTRKKLHETEDLIDYFRQKREQLSDNPRQDVSRPTRSSEGDLTPYATTGRLGLSEYEDPVFTSDIASGNKILKKANKAASKNWKSRFENESLNRKAGTQRAKSMSETDLSTTRKRRKGFFRRLFGGRKRRQVSMYLPGQDAENNDLEYGSRRKMSSRNFKIPTPKFRFSRSSSLNSSRKTSPDRSTNKRRFGFIPFPKKRKSRGMLVISEPSDDVRGVDLLPSGKYAVAGTMFHVTGEKKDEQIVTVDETKMTRTSTDSLANPRDLKQETNGAVNGEPGSNVKLRATSPRQEKRPFSFSTFQQSPIEVCSRKEIALTFPPVIEARRSSLPSGELNGTDDAEKRGRSPVSPSTHGKITGESGDSVFDDECMPAGIRMLRPGKPSRKPVSAASPNIPVEAVQKGLYTNTRATASVPTTSIAASQTCTLDHRRAPPSSSFSPDEQHRPFFNDVTTNKARPASVALSDDVTSSGSDSFTAMKTCDQSLVNEIFSYLKDNAPENATIGTYTGDQSSGSESEALPYDDHYAMPGVKAKNVKNTDSRSQDGDHSSNSDLPNDDGYEQQNDLKTLHQALSEVKTLTSDDSGEEHDSDGNSSSKSLGCESYDLTAKEERDLTHNYPWQPVILKTYRSMNTDSSEVDRDGDRDTQALAEHAILSEQVESENDSVQSDVVVGGHSTPVSESSSTEFEMRQKNLSTAVKKVGNRNSSTYDSYQNLITPLGFERRVRISHGPKPPLPPKPVIFH